ncbi:MAG: hypothetical protein FIA82_09400 [Melioribacter sp.]|nr:hypothetical protein [Melioribacter sp.]
MNLSKICRAFINSLLLLLFMCTTIYSQTDVNKFLGQEFDLTNRIVDTIHDFQMETKVILYAPDGKRTGAEVFKLLLQAQPLTKSKTKYTCKNYQWIKNDSAIVSIPSLEGWSYLFNKDIDANEEKGQLFGISHSQFENLKDEKGNILEPAKTYFVYNTFIDFHSICDIFGRETNEDNGIQNLKTIGQKIIHSASFSEPPVNLGSKIKEGSKFKNGEITLTLKGIGYINNQPCAIVGYDSGESYFKMIIEPMPNFTVNTVGSSHYFGDIYINLKSKWVQKADLTEFVVSETTIPGMNKISTAIERQLSIRMLD